jgi:hypothetical protein
MTSTRERDAIRAAMGRLLAGEPLHSDGALTVVSLAQEAQVKRHVLTHRHTDLKDEFYAKVRGQGHVPASELKLRENLAGTEARLVAANAEVAELNATVEQMARVINLLTMENEAFRERAESGRNKVVPMR